MSTRARLVLATAVLAVGVVADVCAAELQFPMWACLLVVVGLLVTLRELLRAWDAVEQEMAGPRRFDSGGHVTLLEHDAEIIPIRRGPGDAA